MANMLSSGPQQAPPALQELVRSGANPPTQDAISVRENYASLCLSAAVEVPRQEFLNAANLT